LSSSSVVVSSKKKKRVWGQLCECLSEAAAHLPPTVCQVLLQALFIADLRNELYTHLGFVYLEFSCTHAPFVFSSIQPYLLIAIAVLFYLEFTWEVPLPHSLVKRATRQLLLQAFLFPWLLGCCHHSFLLRPACLFTVHLRGCSSPTLQSSGSPTLFAMCLFFFFSCLFIIQFVFFFFPWVGVSLSRGLC
jgi:hypothetical protein